MASWEPVDIDPIDCDEIGDEYDKWDDDLIKVLEKRFNVLRHFNETLYESSDEDTIDKAMKTKDALKHDTINLVANQIYDKLIISFNDTRKRLGIKGGIPIAEPIRNYRDFYPEDDGNLYYIYKEEEINLGNINERLKPLWEIRKLGVHKLQSMSFMDITYKDINPHTKKCAKKRGRLRKLDEKLDERSKAIGSPSTTNTEAIEMIEMTSKDIDTTIKDVEQDTFFIKPDDKDKLLPLRELEGLDKQLRTIKGSLS